VCLPFPYIFSITLYPVPHSPSPKWLTLSPASPHINNFPQRTPLNSLSFRPPPHRSPKFGNYFFFPPIPPSYLATLTHPMFPRSPLSLSQFPLIYVYLVSPSPDFPPAGAFSVPPGPVHFRFRRSGKTNLFPDRSISLISPGHYKGVGLLFSRLFYGLWFLSLVVVRSRLKVCVAIKLLLVPMTPPGFPSYSGS